MKYIVTFLKKSGKVKSRVGCATEKTARYIVDMWMEDKEKKGACIVTNLETKEETFHTK